MKHDHILMTQPLPPKPGVYEHFKGGRYLVPEDSLELDADTMRRRVRYQSLDHGIWFSRLYSDFHAVVLSSEGSCRVPRFRLTSNPIKASDPQVAV